MRNCFWLMAAITIVSHASACASDDYLQVVKPLLEHRCTACHGALKQEGGLRLDSGRRIRQGGDTGPAVIDHRPSQSLLIERISAADDSERMPPDSKPLAPDEIDAIKKWIAAGAPSPRDEIEQADPNDHWAFRAPVLPEIPKLGGTNWALNPIDAFISKRHQEFGIHPLPPADRETLLRRVYLDLVGIPPSRQELNEFLSDRSVDAFENVVNRLLDRPEYGQRWGRHWMDVWRYSDWYGRRAVPDVMNSYPHIWRWRDWIIDSLNDDKGYDRMVQEMLAADELSPGNDRDAVATGFIVRNWFKWNYENWMKDNVEHTAKAFLGLTLQCAHCHDHKYDPLSQEEYFRFRAFFEPLELRQDRVAGLPDPGPFVKYVYAKAYGPSPAGMVRIFDEKLNAPTFMYAKGDARNRIQGRGPVEAGVPKILGGQNFAFERIELPPEAFYPGLKSFIRDEERAKLVQQIEQANQVLAAANAKLLGAEKSLKDLEQAKLKLVANSSADLVQSTITNDRELVLARADCKQASQHLISLQASLRSLEGRILADDARYRGQGDAKQFSRAASQAERIANYETGQWRLAQAETNLLKAQQKQPLDDKAKAALDKAHKELTDSRTALDSARSELAKDSDTYSPLSPIYPRTSTGRRLALARWMTNRDNPLAARVAVNHIWMRHFGRGLVDTPSNFGRSGHPPTHPELLDFLAMELMDHGWSMKHIHRLIVTSQTYRLRSHLGAAQHPNQTVDPDNQNYWRANTLRMEAEVVRDSLLSVSGELDSAIGGPEIDAAQGLASNRRSMYFTIHGEGKMQFLELFDAADVCDCYQRTTSVRPQQALALTNAELPLRVSQALAKRLWDDARQEIASRSAHVSETGSETTAAVLNEFVLFAFESVLARHPSAEEIQASMDFVADQTKIIASGEQLGASPADEQPASLPMAADQRARMALVHALFSHNDFVTIR